MKKHGWLLFMVMMLVAISPVFGDSFEKHYIDLDQLLLDTSGMYIKIDESYLEVCAIFFDKDENRYYVQKKETKWKCPNCGKYNEPKKNNCWYCGWPWGPP